MRVLPYAAVALGALGMCAISIPALAEGISLTVDAKGPLVLGEIAEAPVTILAPETKETEDRPLRVAVNVGSFSAVEKVRPGAYRAVYHLPETRFPQVALVAVWRETGPDATVDFLRIPLSGRTKLPVKSTRGAQIRVLAGDVTYGPVIADQKGKAELMIAVPPGVNEVVATSSKGRELSQGTVAVDVPPYNRLTLAVTPYLIPADGQSSATVHAFYDVERDPPPIERIRISVERGELKPIGARGNRYRFNFVPARGIEAGGVKLRALVAGDKASHAEAEIALGLPVPERIVSRGLSGPLFADGTSTANLGVLVLDRLGLGVPKLAVTASAARTMIEVREIGRGEYAVALAGPSAYPKNGKLAVLVRAEDRTGAKARVEAALDVDVAPPPWPVRAEIEADPKVPIADGETPFLVLVRAFDAAGRPFGAGGLSMTADGARISGMEHVQDGTYRAEVLPARGLEALDLAIRDESGHLSASRQVSLRAPPSLFSAGVFAGGAYNAVLIPTVGIEAGVRPPILERRLAVFLRASYREVPRAIEIAGLGSIDTKLQVLPISFGAAFDAFQEEALRVYGAAAFEVVPFAARETIAIQGTATYRRIAPGVEVIAGVAFHDVFLEIEGSWASISAPDLKTPAPALLLVAGYRLGL